MCCLCLNSTNSGFESYVSADAVNRSLLAVNQSITTTRENPNATANVKVLVEAIQKVGFIVCPFYDQFYDKSFLTLIDGIVT